MNKITSRRSANFTPPQDIPNPQSARRSHEAVRTATRLLTEATATNDGTKIVKAEQALNRAREKYSAMRGGLTDGERCELDVYIQRRNAECGGSVK